MTAILWLVATLCAVAALATYVLAVIGSKGDWLAPFDNLGLIGIVAALLLCAFAAGVGAGLGG